ncbi:Hsp20/alpha crystallin family protein [Roseburia sp. MUC/MUC-530-WT-4D]|uniref:Hsp20/alpha crystallin family protein n=1 Tax=Roseburia porci TaxID=2605790 RepID=A0A6L5YRT8_9FIRM|nr:Hsp20/alpha crystallin family protein [Roseburia porci]MCI5515936.1 Hsp20/alpha crystallin family protein [Roseburia sp.]MDD6742256.1 Hsp20/alpha crystallin family protein [Roseburia porci]MST75028.1 Hsp20/alpha crystallin family protein [Roseburia porci]
MLMPSIFGENLFDDWFDSFDNFPFYMDKDMNNAEKKLYGKKAGRIMKTDIKETDKGYELIVDLPGFTKDEIKASVENGYLTISAAKGLDKDEKEKESGRYIRQERYAGSCERSFYVGDAVKQEDVKAEFKHGILKLFVPKKEAEKAVEQNKYIAIEG